MIIITKKDLFFSKVDKYFESGLFTEIYSDENIVIVNVYDKYYMYCPIHLIEEKGEALGFFTIKEKIPEYIEDSTLVYPLIKQMSRRDMKELLYVLNEELYEYMLQDRQKIFDKLPSNLIDKVMEENILNQKKIK